MLSRLLNGACARVFRAAANGLVGFPKAEPTVGRNPHGWFFPPHKVVLSHFLNEKTRVVVEMGSWLGKSTRFISSVAPNAFVFAIDKWSNECAICHRLVLSIRSDRV